MSFLQRHPASRWIAPALAVGVAAGVPLVGHSANAAPALPQKTPQQLVDAVLSAKVAGFSGTLESHADLGLPALPSSMSQTTSGVAGLPVALLTGTHTMKVWHAEGTGDRVALLSDQAETDVISNRTDAWIWNSGDRTAQHESFAAARARVKAEHAKRAAEEKARPQAKASQTTASQATGDQAKRAGTHGPAMTPQQVSAKVLEALGPSTAISSTDNTTIAGRPAYDLVLTPKAAATKVGSVHIAVDAATSMPLRVQVFAKGSSNPALEVGFTDITYSVPSASTFTFSAPAGAKVTEMGAQSAEQKQAAAAKSATAKGTQAKGAKTGAKTGVKAPRPTIVGRDWTTVVVASMPQQKPAAKGTTGTSAQQMASLLNSLPAVSGAWGKGRLLDTALFSAVITSDGRVAAGAVQPSSLYAALATK